MLQSDLREEGGLETVYSVAVRRDRNRHGGSARYNDTRLLADCHALAATRANLLGALASATRDNASERRRIHEELERLCDDLAGYTKRVASRPATTTRGLQGKRAVADLLLAELGDDPAPLCDALVVSLLTDFEAVHLPTVASSSIGVEGRPDQALIEACEVCLSEIEEICAECARLGTLAPSDEQEHRTATLMSQLRRTRGLIVGVADMPAHSTPGARLKARLLGRLMNIGDADAHHQRLMLARSFTADVASFGPDLELEDGTGHDGARWLSNLATRIWPRRA